MIKNNKKASKRVKHAWKYQFPEMEEELYREYKKLFEQENWKRTAMLSGLVYQIGSGWWAWSVNLLGAPHWKYHAWSCQILQDFTRHGKS